MPAHLSSEARFLRLANALTRSGYEDFLQILAVELTHILNVEYVLIAEVAEGSWRAETLAVAFSGKLVDNFEYDLKGTPCETVLARDVCAYSHGVADRFPEDSLLADMGVESYAGMPILAADGRKLGLIGAMSKRPCEMQEAEREILRIAAAQVGAELDLSSRQRRIRVLTYEDAITGLPNRQRLLDWLEDHQAVSCLLLIDVRRFKDINDLHGHLVGDAILYAVAERLRSRLGGRGFLARLSGNEYVLVPTDDWSETIEGYARDIVSWFREPVISGASRFQIDVTIGAACGREVARAGVVNFAAELLRRAGVGLAEAKTSGAPFMLFNLAMVDSLNHRQRIYEKLLSALRENRLSLNFQPQIDLETGRLSGAEVLCRWHDSELGWISPAQFIPLAEERGLMSELGDWVLKNTRQQLEEWQARGLPFQGKLSVNISTRQLESVDFPDRLAAMFVGRCASELVLELTETSMMRAPEMNLRQMSRLRDLGFAWAVDDFGTGYSSLAYLTRMNAGYLKIDRSFVSRVPNSQHDEAIIRTIVAMAQALGMELIAEGIETDEQLNYVRSIGCRFGQGFYISRPLTPDAFADQWLRAT